MIQWKPENMGFNDYGLDFSNPDFSKYAEVYGATGYRIDAADQLILIIEQAFDSGGVHLIWVSVD